MGYLYSILSLEVPIVQRLQWLRHLVYEPSTLKLIEKSKSYTKPSFVKVNSQAFKPQISEMLLKRVI
jgi:hypothetical protein